MSVENRVSTGIENFDDLIEGGFPNRSLVILAGEAGSGKTTFSAQYLNHGIASLNETGMYASFAENQNVFYNNMKRLGMDFEAYDSNGKFKFLPLSLAHTTIPDVLNVMMTELSRLKAKRLVIDSFSAMAQAFKSQAEARNLLYTLLSKMWQSNIECTTLLLVERQLNERHVGFGVEAFVADGMIALTQSSDKGFLERKLQVTKMRGTAIRTQAMNYDITDRGLIIYRLPQIAPIEKVFAEKLSTGVTGLDEMLGGGVPRASTTMTVGSSGTGKTTTALHFLVRGAEEKERGLFVSFEEPVAKVIQHAEAFGWRMKDFMTDGLLKVEYFEIERHNAQEQFKKVGDMLQEYRPKRFVVDSISHIQRVLSEGEYFEYLRHWINYLVAHDITTLFTINGKFEAPMTETGASTLADNIISLRDVELESALKRSLIVYKTRGTAHDRAIREFEITNKGIVVGGKFQGVEQVLGGSARRVSRSIDDVIGKIDEALGKSSRDEANSSTRGRDKAGRS